MINIAMSLYKYLVQAQEIKYSAFSLIPKCFFHLGREHMLKSNTIRVRLAFQINPIETSPNLGSCLSYYINSGVAQ